MSKSLKKREIIDRVHPFYFAIPACVILFGFYLLPIFLNLGYAFTDWSAYKGEINFIGLENFRELFVQSNLMLKVLKNSVLFAITIVIGQNLIGFLLAMLLEKKTRLNTIARTIIFTPCVVAIIVWGFLFSTILHSKGVLNGILSTIFNATIKIPWLASLDFTIFSVGMVNVWIWSGFTMMIYVNSLNAIPQEVIEAAEIDGIGWFGKVRHIIIPLIVPGITINVVLSAIGGLKVFDIVMTLTRGGPARATEVFNTFIYEKFSSGLYGYSSAINFVLIVFIAAIAFPLYLKLSSKVVEA